jgi:hypothetical protein
MKAAFASRLTALLVAPAIVLSAFAQPSPIAAEPTPTTRILAIGTVTPGADSARVRMILPAEMRATAQLYLEGKIDQWYSLQGRQGVAFILNVTDLAAAQDMLERLPLGQAHLMSFQLLPLAPLNPLRQLTGTPPAP